MSLYKSIFDTVYNDIRFIELNSINKVLHTDETPSMTTVGRAAQSQWLRVFLDAIAIWAQKNPSASAAPQSFLPDHNEDIKSIMYPTATVSSETPSDVASTDEETV